MPLAFIIAFTRARWQQQKTHAEEGVMQRWREVEGVLGGGHERRLMERVSCMEGGLREGCLRDNSNCFTFLFDLFSIYGAMQAIRKVFLIVGWCNAVFIFNTQQQLYLSKVIFFYLFKRIIRNI